MKHKNKRNLYDDSIILLGVSRLTLATSFFLAGVGTNFVTPLAMAYFFLTGVATMETNEIFPKKTGVHKPEALDNYNHHTSEENLKEIIH